MLFGIIPTNQVNAYSYYNTFYQPWEGSAAYEGPKEVTSNANVNPSVNATQTTYCLILPDKLTVVSNYIKLSTTATKKFTYKSGHGGSGENYRLNYFPSSRNYSTYNVYGTWKP